MVNIDEREEDADWIKRFEMRGLYDATQPRNPKGAPGGGRWTDGPDGPVLMLPATEKDAARLKELKVPPKWTNVHLSQDPDSALQATGTDVKGRTQYKYSAEHSEHAAAEKFARLKDFTAALPNIREHIAEDMKRGRPDREEASVLHLIDKTGFRVGSETDTKAEQQAYGATTLRSEHVKVDPPTTDFSFVGKKGVTIHKRVTDASLAKMMETRSKKQGKLFDTTDGAVRDYLHKIAGDFKVKDFRTYHGTAVALQTMKGMKKPRTKTELKKAQAFVSKAVADHLGNTPAVAKASYIDPAVWGRWTSTK